MGTTQLVKSVDKSDGVVAVTEQYCLRTLFKHGECGHWSNICVQTIPDSDAGSFSSHFDEIL